MIRALIFDCFGVLYHGSLGHLRQLLPPDQRQELNDLSMSSDYGYISRQEYFDKASEIMGMSPAELEAITAKQHIRNELLVEYVKSMKSEYKIGLLSNVGSDVMNGLFSPAEQAELFDVVVLSSDIGMTKPNPAIFEFTATKLGLLPEECIMIDDLLLNIEGAQQTGMKGVVYSTIEQAKRAIDEHLRAGADA
ncbi:Alpha-D-glucose-1-phosphate phosphatase YihX [compost metagenome]